MDAFLIKTLVESESLTMQKIVLKISQISGVFALNTLFAALLQYITTLHGRLETMNFENIRLLDGMHEGLLILNKTTPEQKREVMFCNNSAQKLLNKAILFHEASVQQDQPQSAKKTNGIERLIFPKMFHSVKVETIGCSAQ